MAFGNGADALAVFVRQFVIHQLVQAAAAHVPCRPCQHARHDQRQDRIGQRPAHPGRQDQRRDHAQITEKVAGIVAAVGFDRDAAGLRDHPPLIGNQRKRDANRNHHHRQRGYGVVDRRGIGDAPHHFDGQEQRGRGDERALCQARQRFGLAMAKAVLGIGRRQRMADCQHVEQRGQKIERRVRHAGQHRHRVRCEIGPGLDHHQEGRHRHGGDGRAFHQGAGLSHRKFPCKR